MDAISSTTAASVATRISESDGTARDVGIAVLKKAMDSQASAAAQLIEALPTPASKLPAHLGRNVNTVA